jgi:hypothetical protein
MSNNFVIVSAAALLALVAVLVAGPNSKSSVQNAAAVDSSFSIFDLTRRGRDLPEESYPAH